MKGSMLALIAVMFCLQCAAADAPPSAAGTTAGPSVIFSSELKDAPGKKLVVVALTLAPKGKSPPHPHHHPGSVYVYVTQGVARLGLKGQPVKEVHVGESFFEAPGSVHAVSESASATGPAYAIAVMLVPDGAPLATPEVADHHGEANK